jgi:hypothetical protein
MAINKRLIKSNDWVPTSFNTVTYTGNGGTQAITGVGFQPDFVWAKSRTLTTAHNVFDSIRGATKYISTNLTDAEATVANSLQSFNTDGFTVGINPGLNWLSDNYVAWCWKAGGAAVTNTDGTITSQVSANVDAGFSVVTFTAIGAVTSVGHGLGQKPSIIFKKNRSVSEGWFTQQYMYVPSGNAAYGYLNTTAAFTGFTDSLTNDTVFQEGGTNGQNYVSYCFAEVAGFSKFGSYSGGASAIDLGFAPSFIMIKRSDSASDWYMLDITRDGDNNLNTFLYANLSNAENTSGTTGVTVSGNTILPYGSLTTGGGTFIYMAFANQF